MRRLPLPFVLSTGAVLWSVALVGLAYVLPVYSVESDTGSCTAGGHCTSTTATSGATLVDMNGDGVLVVIGILAGIALVGWLGLHLYCALGSRAGRVAGSCAAILMAGFTMISFGLWIFTLPTALRMIAAAATTVGPGARRTA